MNKTLQKSLRRFQEGKKQSPAYSSNRRWFSSGPGGTMAELEKLKLRHPPAGKTIADAFKSMPQNAIVVEIGTDRGESALLIDKHCSPKELYLIDPWSLSEWSNDRWDIKEAKEETFKKFTNKDNVTIIQDFSAEASMKFDNHYFDWIYIDASYEYADYKKDLAYWLPKVKKGGYILGEYFNPFQGPRWPAYGAIAEFIIKYVAKKPEIMDHLQVQRKKAYEDYSKYIKNLDDFHLENNPENEKTLEFMLYACPWEVKVINNKESWFAPFEWELAATHEITFLPSSWITDIILSHVDHFSIQRYRGDICKLRIGDWVDDLDYEEIIEEANKA